MGCSDSGTWYFSTPMTNTTTNGAVVVDMTFLGAALAGAKAPRIDRMKIKITQTGTVAVGDTARGDLFWASLNSVYLRDQYGARIPNFSGTELQKVAKYLYGEQFQDPATVAGGGGGAAFTNLETELWLPFGDIPKAVRPQDFRVDARHFFNGQLICGVTIGAIGGGTNLLTTTSVTIQLWCHVVDEGKDTAGPRLVLNKQTFNQNIQQFPLGRNGLLFFPLMYVGDANVNIQTPNTWTGAGAQNITSQLLGLRVVPDDVLVDDYAWASPQARQSDVNGTVPTEDPVFLGQVLPLDNPRWDAPVLAEQPIASQLDFLSDLAFGSFPTGAEMLLGIIEDRPSDQCGNNEVPVAAIRANGKLDAVSAVAPVLERKVPVIVTRA